MSTASSALPLTAETIAIGTELLIGGRSDFNSLFLADELGIEADERGLREVVEASGQLRRMRDQLLGERGPLGRSAGH